MITPRGITYGGALEDPGTLAKALEVNALHAIPTNSDRYLCKICLVNFVDIFAGDTICANCVLMERVYYDMGNT